MAANHKFLVHPTTNEVFRCDVVETKTNQTISQHKNLCLALDKAERLNVKAAATVRLRDVPKEAPRCGYEDDRYRCPRGALAPSAT